MKKLILLSIIYISFLGKMNAQDPLSDHYLFNQVYHNPAAAGANNKKVITLNYRDQWRGISTFKNVFASYEHPVEKLNSTFGLTILYDKLSRHTRSNIGLTYNYNIKILEELEFRVGTQVSILSGTTKFSEFGSATIDPNTPSNDRSGSSIDFAVGVLSTFKKLKIGLSIQHLLEPNITTTSPDVTILYRARHYYYFVSYTFDVTPQFQISPSVINRRAQYSSNFDLTNYLVFKKTISLGITYRKTPRTDNHEWVSLFGIQLKEKINFQFSANFNKSFFGNSIEGLVQYKF
ncbi:MAG: PorP/SprF family type IX secretion system membrane protein [Saprospiraceae bacterium]